MNVVSTPLTWLPWPCYQAATCSLYLPLLHHIESMQKQSQDAHTNNKQNTSMYKRNEIIPAIMTETLNKEKPNKLIRTGAKIA